jgi:multiple sugar transport system substrate-binding protein
VLWRRRNGEPFRAATEVATKYIIIDMYAKAVQGMAAEEAVHNELAKISAQSTSSTWRGR